MKEIGHVVGFAVCAGFFGLILIGGAYEMRVWWEDRHALKRAALFEMQHLARQDFELIEQEREMREEAEDQAALAEAAFRYELSMAGLDVTWQEILSLPEATVA